MFNLSTINEVAVVMTENELINRYNILQKRSNKYLRVKDTLKSSDTLQYPLTF